ncbi:MAG: hypothetical protein K0U59_01920 [Gammaproteobacteria bacterium]|nr:hypothetical protein [Gammaproteobacteria bacterium]
MNIKLLLLFTITVTVTMDSALADFESGSLIVRAGAAYVETKDGNVAYNTTKAELMPSEGGESTTYYVDTKIDLGSGTTWFINGSYFFVNNWALELYHANKADLSAKLAISEFSSTFDSTGRKYKLDDFETHVTSVYIDWYPVDLKYSVQPYLGFGISYVDVKQSFISPVFKGGDMRGRLDVGSSVDWTAQVGVDIELGRDSNWLLNASVMYVNADPEYELGFNWNSLDNQVIPVRERKSLNYDSWIYNLGFGYRFNL